MTTEDYDLPEFDMPEDHVAWFASHGWTPRAERDSGETFAPNFTKMSPSGIRHSLYWDGKRAFQTDKHVYQLESSIPDKHKGWRSLHSDRDAVFETDNPQAVEDKAKENERAWLTGAQHDKGINPGLLYFMKPENDSWDRGAWVEPVDESPGTSTEFGKFVEPKEKLHPYWRGGPGGRSGLHRLNSVTDDWFVFTAAEAGRTTVYHLTDNPRFKLDETFAPEDNSLSINPRDGRRGLYVGKPERWASPPYNYKRPYVVELSMPSDLKEGGRWGGENFIPADQFSDVRVERVMPYDHYIRREYGLPGETEEYHSQTYDTGEPLKNPGPYSNNRYREGFDTKKEIDTRDPRQWSDEQHRDYLKKRRQVLHDVYGWGWNEFTDDGGWRTPEESDFDRDGEFIRRDRDGNVMTRGRHASVIHEARRTDSKPIFDAEMAGPSGKLQKLMDNTTEVDPDPHLSDLYGGAKWHKDYERLVGGRHGFEGGYQAELDDTGGVAYHKGGQWTNPLGKRVPVAHVIKPVLARTPDRMVASDPKHEVQYFAVSSLPGDEGELFRTLQEAVDRPRSLANRWDHPGRGYYPRTKKMATMIPFNRDEDDEHLRQVFGVDPYDGGQLGGPTAIHPKSGYRVQYGLHRRLHTPKEGEVPAELAVDDYGPMEGFHLPQRDVAREPITHVYRAMSASEVNQALKEGFIQSDGRGIIADWEGTNAGLSPATARSYISTSEPSVIAKIRVHPEDGWFAIHHDGYVRTRNPIPIDRIEAISKAYHHEPDPDSRYGRMRTIREAAAKGFPNPYHGNPEFGGNPEFSHTWFHGTKGVPEFGESRSNRGSGDAARIALPPEERMKGSGWHQPNQYLGIHFTPLHEVGRKFSFSFNKQPGGSIVHARLAFDNPAHYLTEKHLNYAVADWASKNFPEWHDQKLNDNLAWNYSDREGTHRDFSQVPKGYGDKAQDVLQWHPYLPEIVQGFNKHLRDQGHRGITYGNMVEGPYLTNATVGGEEANKYLRATEDWPHDTPRHISAIAQPEDIQIAHVEHVAPWDTEPQEGQVTWEQAGALDEPDDMKDQVLNWHRAAGGEYPQLPMQHEAAVNADGADLSVEEYQGTEGNNSHITRNEYGTVPLSWISHLRGGAGEMPNQHRNYHGEDWEHFKSQVAAGEPGYSSPIFIVVKHGEEPKIYEGNHRRDAYKENAFASGRLIANTQVPVEVRYFGHAERQGTLGERAMRREAAAEWWKFTAFDSDKFGEDDPATPSWREVGKANRDDAEGPLTEWEQANPGKTIDNKRLMAMPFGFVPWFHTPGSGDEWPEESGRYPTEADIASGVVQPMVGIKETGDPRDVTVGRDSARWPGRPWGPGDTEMTDMTGKPTHEMSFNPDVDEHGKPIRAEAAADDSEPYHPGYHDLDDLGYEITWRPRPGWLQGDMTDENGVRHTAIYEKGTRGWRGWSTGPGGTRSEWAETPQLLDYKMRQNSRWVAHPNASTLGEAAVTPVEFWGGTSIPMVTDNDFSDLYPTNERIGRPDAKGPQHPRQQLWKLNAVDESGIKAAGIAVIAMDTGRVLMQQRALNPLTCPCGMGVTWDEMNGYQHDDGSVSHDGEFYGQSVSDLLDQGHPEEDNGENGEEEQETEGLQREAALEYDPNEGTWEFPGGKLDEGETPRQAAIREFREEVGQDLPPGVFVGAWLSPGGLVVAANAASPILDGADPRAMGEEQQYGIDGVCPTPGRGDDPELQRMAAGVEPPNEHKLALIAQGWKPSQPWEPGMPEHLRLQPDFIRTSPATGIYHNVSWNGHEKKWMYDATVPHWDQERFRETRRSINQNDPRRNLNGKGNIPLDDPADVEKAFRHSERSYLLGSEHGESGIVQHFNDRSTFEDRWGDETPRADRPDYYPDIAAVTQRSEPAYERLREGNPWRAGGDDPEYPEHGFIPYYIPKPGESWIEGYHNLEMLNEPPHQNPFGGIEKLNSHPGDRDRWQTGDCLQYAVALRQLHPELRFGTAGHTELGGGDASEGWVPRHHFVHDDIYYYDSLGKHPISDLSSRYGYDHVELDGDENDWGFPDQDWPDEDVAAAKEHWLSREASSEKKIYWRVHPYNRPFSPDDAYSQEWGDRDGQKDRGYSAFETPHELFSYFNPGERGSDSSRIIEFSGQRVGTGMDGEPLVVPDMDHVREHYWGSLRNQIGNDVVDEIDRRNGWENYPHLDKKGAAKKAPIYKGFIYLIENERDIDLGNREIANPDDPDGDMSEQSAWWDIADAKKNPALRSEVKQTPWAELELWADKSVRANKEVKEALAKLGMGLDKQDHDDEGMEHEASVKLAAPLPHWHEYGDDGYDPYESGILYPERWKNVGRRTTYGTEPREDEPYYQIQYQRGDNDDHFIQAVDPITGDEHGMMWWNSSDGNIADIGSMRHGLADVLIDRAKELSAKHRWKSPKHSISLTRKGAAWVAKRMAAGHDDEFDNPVNYRKWFQRHHGQHYLGAKLLPKEAASKEPEDVQKHNPEDALKGIPREPVRPGDPGAGEPWWVYEPVKKEAALPDDNDSQAWRDQFDALTDPLAEEGVGDRHDEMWQHVRDIMNDPDASEEHRDAAHKLDGAFSELDRRAQIAHQWGRDNPGRVALFESNGFRFNPDSGRVQFTKTDDNGWIHTIEPDAYESYHGTANSDGVGWRVSTDDPSNPLPGLGPDLLPASEHRSRTLHAQTGDGADDDELALQLHQHNLEHADFLSHGWEFKGSGWQYKKTDADGTQHVAFPNRRVENVRGYSPIIHETPGWNVNTTRFAQPGDRVGKTTQTQHPTHLDAILAHQEGPGTIKEASTKLAMPRNEEYLNSLEFRFEPADDVNVHYHAITAHGPDGFQHGSIDWWPDTGRIMGVSVSDEDRRKGLGTELYRRAVDKAAEQGIKLRHSLTLLSDGEKIIRAIGDEPGGYVFGGKTAAPLTEYEPAVHGIEGSGEGALNRKVTLPSGEWLAKSPHHKHMNDPYYHHDDLDYFQGRASEDVDLEEFASRLGRALSDPDDEPIVPEVVRGDKASDPGPTAYVRRYPEYRDMDYGWLDYDDLEHHTHSPRGKVMGYFHSVLADGDHVDHHNMLLLGDPMEESSEKIQRMPTVSIDHTHSSLPAYAEMLAGGDPDEEKQGRWMHRGELSPYEEHFLRAQASGSDYQTIRRRSKNPLAPGDTERALAASETMRPWARVRGVESWLDAAQHRMRLLGRRASGTESMFPYQMKHERPTISTQRTGSVQKTAVAWIDRGFHSDCGCAIKQMKLLDQDQPVQGWMTDHRSHGGRVRWKVTRDGVAVEQGKDRHVSWAEKEMLDAYGRVVGGMSTTAAWWTVAS